MNRRYVEVDRTARLCDADTTSRFAVIGIFAIVVVICGLCLPALFGCTDASAQPPPDTGIFWAGAFADSARTRDCVEGGVGTTFTLNVWAWAPSRQANYVAVRFRFPENIELVGRPVLNPLVMDLLFTHFIDGSVEWHFLLSDCPTGWILLCRQDCTIVSDDPSEITVVEDVSLARDCNFVLESLGVLSSLRVGTGDCSPLPVVPSTWSTIKSLYR